MQMVVTGPLVVRVIPWNLVDGFVNLVWNYKHRHLSLVAQFRQLGRIKLSTTFRWRTAKKTILVANGRGRLVVFSLRQIEQSRPTFSLLSWQIVHWRGEIHLLSASNLLNLDVIEIKHLCCKTFICCNKIHWTVGVCAFIFLRILPDCTRMCREVPKDSS